VYTINYQSTSAQYYQHDMTRNEHYIKPKQTIHVHDNYFVITFQTSFSKSILDVSIGQLILDVGESPSHVGKMTGNQLSELLIVISPKMPTKSSS